MKKPLDVFVMQKVKEFRLRHNLLASDIADVIGTSVNFVNNVETLTSPDKYNLYHFETFAKSADVLVRVFSKTF